MPKTTNFTGAHSGATYHVTTNGHRRDIVDAWELTPDERADFDYLDWEALENGDDSASFVRYRGTLLDLGDIPRAGDDLSAAGWDGFISDTYFSGIAVRFVKDDGSGDDAVVVARVAILD